MSSVPAREYDAVEKPHEIMQFSGDTSWMTFSVLDRYCSPTEPCHLRRSAPRRHARRRRADAHQDIKVRSAKMKSEIATVDCMQAPFPHRLEPVATDGAASACIGARPSATLEVFVVMELPCQSEWARAILRDCQTRSLFCQVRTSPMGGTTKCPRCAGRRLTSSATPRRRAPLASRHSRAAPARPTAIAPCGAR